MLKRILYFRLYRKMYSAARKDDWQTAYYTAKRLNDAEAIYYCRLCYVVQLMLDEQKHYGI